MRDGRYDLFKEHCTVTVGMKATFDGCQTACISDASWGKISMKMSHGLFVGGRPVGHG